MSARFRPFRILAKVRESANITSFHLEPADGEPSWSASPGQYLTLRLPHEDGALLRTYSVSTDTADTRTTRITVKREGTPPGLPGAPPGRGSCWLHDHAVEGMTLEVAAPRGRFVLDEDSTRPVVLLSGGVGQTPLLSMLYALAHGKRSAWYIHACENGEVHALNAEVEALIRRAGGRLRHHVVYRSPLAEDVPGFHTSGLIDKALLQSLLPLDDYDCYLCGPLPFMVALYRLLRVLGVPETRIAHEFFGKAKSLAVLAAEADAAEAGQDAATEDATPSGVEGARGPGSSAPPALAALANLTDPGARAAPDDASPIGIASRALPAGDEAAASRAPSASCDARRSAPPKAASATASAADRDEGGDEEVVFARTGISARWDDGAGTLLELAEAAGLAPAFSCRSGICNTCLCDLRDGEIEYVEEPLAAPDPGKVLICCSRPRGRVVLDL